MEFTDFLYWTLCLIACFCFIADISFIRKRLQAESMRERHHCEIMIFCCSFSTIAVILLILIFDTLML